MRLHSEVILVVLAAALPEVFAVEASTTAPTRTERADVPDRSVELASGASQQASQASGAAGSAPYLIDSRGIVVSGSGGECWRTGTWTPAQAMVVGCDGVLARAQPVPAPSQPGKAEVAPRAPSGQASTAPVRPARAAPEATPATSSEPRTEKVTFDTDTFFDFDKSELKPEGKAKLDTLAARIADAAFEVAVAVGHTDGIGPKAYNQRLSELRAKAVVDYLGEKGLPQEQIFSEGKGETQPVASNASKAGREKNRRVEIEMVAVRPRK